MPKTSGEIQPPNGHAEKQTDKNKGILVTIVIVSVFS